MEDYDWVWEKGVFIKEIRNILLNVITTQIIIQIKNKVELKIASKQFAALF